MNLEKEVRKMRMPGHKHVTEADSKEALATEQPKENDANADRDALMEIPVGYTPIFVAHDMSRPMSIFAILEMHPDDQHDYLDGLQQKYKLTLPDFVDFLQIPRRETYGFLKARHVQIFAANELWANKTQQEAWKAFLAQEPELPSGHTDVRRLYAKFLARVPEAKPAPEPIAELKEMVVTDSKEPKKVEVKTMEFAKTYKLTLELTATEMEKLNEVLDFVMCHRGEKLAINYCCMGPKYTSHAVINGDRDSDDDTHSAF